MRSLAWLLVQTGVVLALYSSNSPVIDIKGFNFRSQVLDDPSLWVVEFYAPWCGHCRNFAPEYEKAAKELSKLYVKVGSVNCDAEINKQLCNEQGIQGFPTVKLFSNKPLEKGKKLKKKIVSYEQGRSAEILVDFTKSHIQSNVKLLKSSLNEKDFTSGTKPARNGPMLFKPFLDIGKSRNLTHFVMISDKHATPKPFYKGLSMRFFGKAVLGYSRDKKVANELLQTESTFPVFCVLDAEGAVVEKLIGDQVTRKSIMKTITTFVKIQKDTKKIDKEKSEKYKKPVKKAEKPDVDKSQKPKKVKVPEKPAKKTEKLKNKADSDESKSDL